MLRKVIKVSLIIVLILISIGTTLYFFFIYEKPVDQVALNSFLEDQPIIDVHIHITKGYQTNVLYNKYDSDIDKAKIKWMTSELDKNNIVLTLAGGPAELLNSWTSFDDRYWVGPIFPCSQLVE